MRCQDRAVHPLDNPVWHALTGPHEKVAERRANAARFLPECAPFAALPDTPDAGAWDDLAALVGDGVAALFRRSIVVPDGWREQMRLATVQMVDVAVVAARDPAAVELSDVDVPEMLELVELTHPGPFATRTIELGTYIGVRAGRELVAMAGQRMRLDGYVEISGVCTHPTHQGSGIAARLVRDQVARIRAEGAVPILHAAADNVGAIRLYEALGFELRSRGEVVVIASERR
jgi:ribosomal protein S18 acetylase RimI-like enzyme